MADRAVKQALHRDLLTYLVQTGQRHVPMRAAWRLGGWKLVARVFRARAVSKISPK